MSCAQFPVLVIVSKSKGQKKAPREMKPTHALIHLDREGNEQKLVEGISREPSGPLGKYQPRREKVNRKTFLFYASTIRLIAFVTGKRACAYE